MIMLSKNNLKNLDVLSELLIFAKRITYPHSYGTIHKPLYRHRL